MEKLAGGCELSISPLFDISLFSLISYFWLTSHEYVDWSTAMIPRCMSDAPLEADIGEIK